MATSDDLSVRRWGRLAITKHKITHQQNEDANSY